MWLPALVGERWIEIRSRNGVGCQYMPCGQQPLALSLTAAHPRTAWPTCLPTGRFVKMVHRTISIRSVLPDQGKESNIKIIFNRQPTPQEINF